MTLLRRKPASAYDSSFLGPALAGARRAALFVVRRQHLLAAILLLAALFLLYRDVVFGGRTFLQLNTVSGTLPTSMGSAFNYQGPPLTPNVLDPGAIAWVNEPYHKGAAEIIKQGELPLWNPFAGLGAPLFTDGNSAVFEPLQVFLYFAPDAYWPLASDIQVLTRFFLAGFFAYLFARSLDLQLIPAVFAGVAFMSSDYFISFGNHPQMRAETLLPLTLYTYDRLLKTSSVRNILICSTSTAWVLLASFPESGFLVLGITGFWCVYNTFWKVHNIALSKQEILSLLIYVALSFVIGIGIAAFFFLPLVENIFNSLHVHVNGVGLKSHPSGFLIPGLLHLTPPYLYISVAILSLLGIFSGLFLKARRRGFLFFAVYSLVFYLKLFGFTFVQWIGLLPAFDQILIRKYITPSINFSFAIIAAFGIEYILTTKHKKRVSYLLLTLYTTLLMYLTSYFRDDNLTNQISSYSLNTSIILISTTIIIISLILYAKKYQHLNVLVLALIIIESTIWSYNIVRPLRYNPFTTPPFIQFLKSQTEPYRVVGLNEILHPEISTGYLIEDITFLEALAKQNKFFFFNQFVSPGETIPVHLMKPGEMFSNQTIEKISEILSLLDGISPSVEGELADKLTKFQGTEQQIYLGRYIDLLSTTHVLANSERRLFRSINLLDLPSVATLLNQPPYSTLGHLNINGDIRQGIAMQVPLQLAIPLFVPPGKVSFQFSTGFSPKVWSQSEKPGRVSYKVFIIDRQGDHQVFYRQITPQRQPDGKWLDAAIDLSPWSGQRITLAMITEGDVSGTAQPDVVYWSAPILQLQDEMTDWALQHIKTLNRVSLTGALLEQNLAKEGLSLGASSLTISGEKRNSLFMIPNNHAQIDVTVPDYPTKLTFSIGVDQQMNSNDTNHGGIGFQISVKDQSTTTEVYRRNVDPDRNQHDQRWIDAQVDLSKWRGQRISLLFSTYHEHKPNSNIAHWSNIELLGEGVGYANPGLARFELVYDGEVQIYQNHYAYPRAFVVHRVETVANTDEAVQKLARSDFNLSTSAVVEGNLPSNWPNSFAQSDTELQASAANIVERTTNTAVISTTLDKPGLLVVADAYDPGWRAYIDGIPTTIFQTDVLLRGVYLDAGAHTVKFVYAPQSLTLGAIISILTLILTLAGTILLRAARYRNNK